MAGIPYTQMVDSQQIEDEQKEFSFDRLTALKEELNEQIKSEGENSRLLELQENFNIWQNQLEIKSAKLAEKEKAIQEQNQTVKQFANWCKGLGLVMFLERILLIWILS